jgi:hypothetical protein
MLSGDAAKRIAREAHPLLNPNPLLAGKKPHHNVEPAMQ